MNDDIIATISQQVGALAYARQVLLYAKDGGAWTQHALSELPEYTRYEKARAARLEAEKTEKAARAALDSAVVSAASAGKIDNKPHPAVTVLDGNLSVAISVPAEKLILATWCQAFLPDAITLDLGAIAKEVKKMRSLSQKPAALHFLDEAGITIETVYSTRIASDLTAWLPGEEEEKVEPIPDADLPF